MSIIDKSNSQTPHVQVWCFSLKKARAPRPVFSFDRTISPSHLKILLGWKAYQLVSPRHRCQWSPAFAWPWLCAEKYEGIGRDQTESQRRLRRIGEVGRLALEEGWGKLAGVVRVEQVAGGSVVAHTFIIHRFNCESEVRPKTALLNNILNNNCNNYM